MAFLFTHFREKITPDGEQVYFGISKDGCNWEQLNDGKPILTANLGEKGCRDIEIIRMHTGEFVILTTDLCIANRMDDNYRVDWKQVNSSGSKCLRMWKTKDLCHFSDEKLIHFGRDDFGCMWAPEIFYDEINQEYMIHWGSTVQEDNFSHMVIFCSKTKDFEQFTSPALFFRKDNEILDTHLRKIGNTYHLFYKNAHHPSMNMHATSESLHGPYKNDDAFEAYMSTLEKPGSYEAPTTLTLADGSWILLLDFFGCEKEKMGYVPFVSPSVGNSDFTMRPCKMSFPYGFKHGGIVEITDEEYNRLKSHYPNS